MKLYAIAYQEDRCYGHGDYGKDISIPCISGYDGSSQKPKIFRNKTNAIAALPKDNAVVIEIETQD